MVAGVLGSRGTRSRRRLSEVQVLPRSSTMPRDRGHSLRCCWERDIRQAVTHRPQDRPHHSSRARYVPVGIRESGESPGITGPRPVSAQDPEAAGQRITPRVAAQADGVGPMCLLTRPLTTAQNDRGRGWSHRAINRVPAQLRCRVRTPADVSRQTRNA